MTGTTGDIIPIVIVPVAALAFWLVMMFHANSHMRWGSQAAADTASAHALEGSVPAQRLSSAGPVVPGQRPGSSWSARPPSNQHSTRRLPVPPRWRRRSARSPASCKKRSKADGPRTRKPRSGLGAPAPRTASSWHNSMHNAVGNVATV